MPVPRMHDDEVLISDDLVTMLLRTQCPHLGDRPVHRLDSWGTDHVIYRLGDDLAVRLPKIGWAGDQGAKERRWLPALAPHLAVDVPVPVFLGSPTDDYPLPWYIAPWLDGAPPATGTLELAEDLARFVRDLQSVDTTGGPPPEPGQRGGPLDLADTSTRPRLEELRGETDVDRLLKIWDDGLHAPAWDEAPRWVHGDLLEGNLLVRESRLHAVIDWGGLKVGDPAVELMIAWTLFDAQTRQRYRDALGFVDDAMWLRGKAWAVSAAAQALPYYRDTNPEIVARSWRVVDAVLAGRRRGPGAD